MAAQMFRICGKRYIMDLYYLLLSNSALTTQFITFMPSHFDVIINLFCPNISQRMVSDILHTSRVVGGGRQLPIVRMVHIQPMRVTGIATLPLLFR